MGAGDTDERLVRRRDRRRRLLLPRGSVRGDISTVCISITYPSAADGPAGVGRRRTWMDGVLAMGTGCRSSVLSRYLGVLQETPHVWRP